ncbi:MAG: general secretion pathway protein GspB [candidate division Zixibacteria bacterium]|nr:general secretion pathway protein GspB [candidate division Zixibacteria bacterium]
MNESLRKKIVYGVAAIALVWAVYNFQSDSNKSSKGNNLVTSERLVAESVVTRTPEKPLDVEHYQSLKWGSDPFRIPTKTQEVQVQQNINWNLSGIVYSSDNPMAIINATTVSVGDTVDNARVVKINRKMVILDYKGSQITLTVTKG